MASDQVIAAQNPEALRQLVQHSANVGALDAGYSEQLSGALDLQSLRVRELIKPGHRAITVSATASVVRETGNQLALVTDGGRMTGVVTMTDVLGKLFPRTMA